MNIPEKPLELKAELNTVHLPGLKKNVVKIKNPKVSKLYV